MLKPFLILTSVIFSLLIQNSIAWADDVYTWTDDMGRVHYSERAPKGVDAEKIKYKKSKFKNPPNNEKNQARRERLKASVDNRKAKAEEKKLADAEKAMLKQQCTQARKVLQTLAGNPRTRFKMDDGVRALTAKERQERRKAAQERIDQTCG